MRLAFPVGRSRLFSPNDSAVEEVIRRALVKLYHYPKCSTCRAAIKLLGELNRDVSLHDISLAPPSVDELRAMFGFQGGELARIINTSGRRYREERLSERLPELPLDDVLQLLASDGMLVKRPFLLGEKVGLVGFHEERWRSTLQGAD